MSLSISIITIITIGSDLQGHLRAWISCPDWPPGWSRTAHGWLSGAEPCSTLHRHPQTRGSYVLYPRTHTHNGVKISYDAHARFTNIYSYTPPHQHTHTHEHILCQSWWKQTQSVLLIQKSKLLMRWSGNSDHSRLSSSTPTFLYHLTKRTEWWQDTLILLYYIFCMGDQIVVTYCRIHWSLL